MQQSLAHLLVQVGHAGIERGALVAWGARCVHRERRHLRNALVLADRNAPDHDLVVLERRGQRHTIRIRPVNNFTKQRFAVVVVLERLVPDVLVRHVFHNLERSDTDVLGRGCPRAFENRGAGFPIEVLIQDVVRREADLVEEREGRVLVQVREEFEGDGRIVDHRQSRDPVGISRDVLGDADDRGRERRSEHRRGNTRHTDHVVGEIDIGGRERLAIMPGQALAQMEREQARIFIELERFGQRTDELGPGIVERDQASIRQQPGVDVLAAGKVAKVEHMAVAGDLRNADRQRAAFHRLLRRRRLRHALQGCGGDRSRCGRCRCRLHQRTSGKLPRGQLSHLVPPCYW